ncbi:MAG: hypothetical protein D6785_07195 [Planctomycetota bacterium]|nr:MAG: hypothetical protein D6785_07195 [Planctomycetota bacterium]
MKTEIFSSHFSKGIELSASEKSFDELQDFLLQCLKDKDGYSLLQSTLAYYYKSQKLLAQVLNKKQFSTSNFHLFQPIIESSPHSNKIRWLGELLWSDKPSFPKPPVFLEPSEFPFFLNLARYFLLQDSSLGLEILENINEDTFGVASKLKWLENFILDYLFLKPSIFAWHEEHFFFYPLHKPIQSFSQNLGNLIGELSFKLLGKLYEKLSLPQMGHQLGKLFWLSQFLMNEDKRIEILYHFVEKQKLAKSLSRWTEAILEPSKGPQLFDEIMQEIKDLCGQGLGAGLVLPLWERFIQISKENKEMEKWLDEEAYPAILPHIFPLEERFRFFLFFGKEKEENKAWKVFQSLPSGISRLKGLLYFSYLEIFQKQIFQDQLFKNLKKINSN